VIKFVIRDRVYCKKHAEHGTISHNDLRWLTAAKKNERNQNDNRKIPLLPCQNPKILRQ